MQYNQTAFQLQLQCEGMTGESGLSGGAIAGIVVGSVVGLTLLVVLILMLIPKTRNAILPHRGRKPMANMENTPGMRHATEMKAKGDSPQTNAGWNTTRPNSLV